VKGEVERLYGPDVLTTVLESNPKATHCFLGGEQAVAILKKKVRGKNIFLIAPYSSDPKRILTKQIVKVLKEKKPDFIWLGISSPKQVRVAELLKNALIKGKIFCVGAAFDFNTGLKAQAPRILMTLSLEWLFRLYQEPRRLWKRYLVHSVIGLFYLPQLVTGVKILK
jgi:N-acetylglucosaminyldiphosphoundecaprenol N-acetyl-beta-D-mannosaminyltransferase